MYHHPYTFTVSHTRDKLSSIECTTLPIIFTISFRYSLLIFAYVYITIIEYLQSLSIFLPLLVDLTYVYIAIVIFLYDNSTAHIECYMRILDFKSLSIDKIYVIIFIMTNLIIYPKLALFKNPRK